MSQTPEPYPIEPHPGGPAPDGSKAKIDSPGLLQGFEEDADFTKDPELDRVIVGAPRPPAAPAIIPPIDPAKPEFVRALWDWEPKLWGAIGAVLLVGAMVATGVNSRSGSSLGTVERVLLTLYNTLLHTGTGVVAVYIAALLLRQRTGRVEVAAARMFAAVSAFALVFHLSFNMPAAQIVETVIAGGVYLLIVAGTFQLWKRDPLLYVVGSHFALWLLVEVGMMLSAAAAVAPVIKGGS
jgi:hypothetical protein